MQPRFKFCKIIRENHWLHGGETSIYRIFTIIDICCAVRCKAQCLTTSLFCVQLNRFAKRICAQHCGPRLHYTDCVLQYCVLSGPLIKTSWGSLNSCLHHCVLDLSSVLSSPPIDNNKNCVVKDPTASSIYCMLKSLDVGHGKDRQGPSEEPAYSND